MENVSIDIMTYLLNTGDFHQEITGETRNLGVFFRALEFTLESCRLNAMFLRFFNLSLIYFDIS